MPYYLTPNTPTAAADIYLGETVKEAEAALLEMDYTAALAALALDGGELPSLPDGQTDIWTIRKTL